MHHRIPCDRDLDSILFLKQFPVESIRFVLNNNDRML
jgi:hypothetical protein